LGKVDSSSDVFLTKPSVVDVKWETMKEILVDNMLARIVNHPEDIHKEIANIVYILNKLVAHHNYNVVNDGL